MDDLILDMNDPFESILIPLIMMNRKKRADYASEDNLFLNFDVNAMMMRLPGYDALEDCLSMVCRKINRITNLRDRDPMNESVEDTFTDLGVYVILLLGLYKRKQEELAQDSIPKHLAQDLFDAVASGLQKAYGEHQQYSANSALPKNVDII
jgi:hypothetical protein